MKISELEESILLVILGLGEEAFGRAIFDSLQKIDDNVSNGALHVSLDRMISKGLLVYRYGGITNRRGGRRKKFYYLTDDAKERLKNKLLKRQRLYNEVPLKVFDEVLNLWS